MQGVRPLHRLLPKKVLVESEHLNKTGYHFAEPCDLDQCTGCLICTLVCPEVVIEVYDE